MSRFLVTVLLCAPPVAAQIPYGHLIYAHRTPSSTVPAIGILDPDHGTATPLLPLTGSLSAHGSRTVAIDPLAPATIYTSTLLSASVVATVPVLQLTGNMWTRTNLSVNVGAAGLPFHLRWAPGYGLLLLYRGGAANRMFLRNMATGIVIAQPTATMLPVNASDMVFWNGKAYATSEGNGTTIVNGTVVEWDLATNTDRIVGSSYPPLSSLGVFAGQLIAGDGTGNLHLIDPVTGGAAVFLTTGLGKITSIAVDAQQRLFVLAENAGSWTIHNALSPIPPLYTSTTAIEDLKVGPSPVPTMLTFGTGCVGSNNAAPKLGFTNAPALGATYGITLANALPNAGAFLILGSSRVLDASGPLPRDLAPLGMSGCTQYVDVVASVFALTGNSGGGQLSFSLPNNPAFTGVRIPVQWLVLDALANGLGATTSSAGEAYAY